MAIEMSPEAHELRPVAAASVGCLFSKRLATRASGHGDDRGALDVVLFAVIPESISIED
jgi:hypothetical protein